MMDLNKIRDELRALPVYQSRMESLTEQIRRTENSLEELLEKCQNESYDVERLQKETLSTYLLRLLGKYEDRLDKELQDEVAAKTAYDEAFVHLGELHRKAGEVQVKIDSLHQKECQYEAALTLRREKLRRQYSKMEGRAYRQWEKERQALIQQITEIDEAASVASKALHAVQEVQKSLRSAEKLATYDLLDRGGLFSHMKKYAHFDNAETASNRLRSLLQILQKELADVQGFNGYSFSPISSDKRFIDYWFDNIFTDLSVHSRIQGNLKDAMQTLKGLQQVLYVLESKRGKVKAQLADNKRREENLLL